MVQKAGHVLKRAAIQDSNLNPRKKAEIQVSNLVFEGPSNKGPFMINYGGGWHRRGSLFLEYCHSGSIF